MTLIEKDVFEYIKENFIYNENGTFSRTDRENSNGSFDKDGYLIIKIKGKQFKAHRLVFMYFNGRFPYKETDHINRIRTDNRIENLRECDRTQNVRNSSIKPNKDTGVVGVRIDKTKGLKKKYATTLGGKTFRFYNLEDAIKKRREYYGNL